MEASLKHTKGGVAPATSAQLVSDTCSSPNRSLAGLEQQHFMFSFPPANTMLSSPPTTLLEEFERVFNYFDSNGDGKISPAELSLCLRTITVELSLEEVVAVLESADSDRDGFLGFDDFVKLVDMNMESEEERERYLREAFEMYEMEGQGCITPKSLKRTLSRLSKSKNLEDCMAMIFCFDLNGDGVLSFNEFRVMML